VNQITFGIGFSGHKKALTVRSGLNQFMLVGKIPSLEQI